MIGGRWRYRSHYAGQFIDLSSSLFRRTYSLGEREGQGVPQVVEVVLLGAAPVMEVQVGLKVINYW